MGLFIEMKTLTFVDFIPIKNPIKAIGFEVFKKQIDRLSLQ